MNNIHNVSSVNSCDIVKTTIVGFAHAANADVTSDQLFHYQTAVVNMLFHYVCIDKVLVMLALFYLS